MNQKARLVTVIFTVIIFIFLLTGTLFTIFFPREINEYENRYAKKISALSLDTYINKTFQDSLESALSDQVPFSDFAKKTFNLSEAIFSGVVIDNIEFDQTQDYIKYKDGIYLYKNRLVYECSKLEYLTSLLDQRCENLNSLMENHPELDFYLYYIELDMDMDFAKNQKSGVYEYLAEKINKDRCSVDRYETSTFEDFCNNFYPTDHHWNYTGSYLGYTKVASLLGIEELFLPVSTFDSDYYFAGSRSVAAGMSDTKKDRMSIYTFDLPKKKITINGMAFDEYGYYDRLINGSLTEANYGIVYGGDYGEIVFDHNSPKKENILIIGDSYDNAILELIAPAFNKTYSVDLRYYTPHTQKTFSFDKYVKENNIDKVLFIGNVNYYTSADFKVGE